MKKEKKKTTQYKIESVYNPFTKERKEVRLIETGKDNDGNFVAQGWFPLESDFTVLLELKKNEPTDKQWTVIGIPQNPIK